MVKSRATGIVALLALVVLGGGASAALGQKQDSRRGHARAHASMHGARGARPHGQHQAQDSSGGRTVRVDDHAQLHMVKYAGAVMIEEGQATGTLPGHTWVRMTISSKVSARFTIHTHGAEIAGRGGASLKSSGRYASFAGWLSISGGRGTYAHARGNGRLYGVIDRRTHTLTVTTTGSLRY